MIVLTLVLSRGAEIPLYSSAPATIGTVQPGSAAEQAGIRPGDKIVAIDGKPIATWDALSLAVLPKAGRELKLAIERAGQPLELSVVPSSESKYELGVLGVEPVIRAQVAEVYANSVAQRAGFQSR